MYIFCNDFFLQYKNIQVLMVLLNLIKPIFVAHSHIWWKIVIFQIKTTSQKQNLFFF